MLQVPGAGEPLCQVREGEDPLCVYLVLHSPYLPLLILLPPTIKYNLLTRTVAKHTDAIERFRNETLRVYGVLEIQLSGKYTGEPRDYLAGNGKGKYSVADIGTWPWVKGWEFSGFSKEDMEPFPHLLKWV